ncbi:hypothetical protein [Kordia jejudonensis]|uniref:hypothetical protein n=1 Tax=Kordia jejudonensis TaxID=1348245 RepID=UPI0006298573|nr:hypothetical protein [Kordia jejudonensis]
MNTISKNNIQTNIQFLVTKKVTNAHGFLHPHVLFDKIQIVATYPIREFYLHDIPNITEYAFQMNKSARLHDNLTIQAQLIQHDEKTVKVSIIVTKTKKKSKTEEVICNALFGFPLQKHPIRKVS